MLKTTLALLVCLAGCMDATLVAEAPDAGPVVIALPDASAAPDAVADAAPVASNAPGKHAHTLSVDGFDRELIVYVPEKARASRAPVVFMLHGSGGDGPHMFQSSGWREKADAEGLIAVFPTGLVYCYFDDGDRRVGTKWSAGKLGEAESLPLCGEADLAALPPEQRALVDHPLADDTAFFRAMLDLLDREYAIDAKRVYVSGFSNGGGMASRLAVEVSDRIAAAAAHAGPISVDEVAARPVPFIFSLGSEDSLIGGKIGFTTPLPVSERLFDKIPAVEGIAALYLAAFQLADTYTYSEGAVGGERVATFAYTTSLAGASNPFRFIVIEGLSHQ